MMYILMRIFRVDKNRFNHYKGKLQQYYPELNRVTDADAFGFLLNLAENRCPMYSQVEDSGLKKMCLTHDCPSHDAMGCKLKEDKQK